MSAAVRLVSRLPRRPRGRPNGSAEAGYQASLEEFRDRILQIRSRLDFEVGARGWCYLLEGERVVDKGEFDACARRDRRCCVYENTPGPRLPPVAGR
jgi:hypothetical protein